MTTRSALLALLLLAGCAREESAPPKTPSPPAVPSPSPRPNPPPPTPVPPPPPPQDPVDFKFDDVRGDTLPVAPVTDWKGHNTEHALLVFASTEKDPTDTANQVLKGGPHPPVVAGGDATLYVDWGLRAGRVVADAVFDRKNGRIIVNARWTGSAGMKDRKESETVAFAFKLGDLQPGKVGVWVRESTPVDKDGPKLTKSMVFVVTK